MSDSYVRDEAADEVLDLYDVLPERADARPAEIEDASLASMIKNTGRKLRGDHGNVRRVACGLHRMHGSLQSRIGTARSSGRAVHLGWLPYRGRLVLADDDGVALLCRHQPSTYSLSRCPTWFPRQAAAAAVPAILA